MLSVSQLKKNPPLQVPLCRNFSSLSDKLLEGIVHLELSLPQVPLSLGSGCLGDSDPEICMQWYMEACVLGTTLGMG